MANQRHHPLTHRIIFHSHHRRLLAHYRPHHHCRRKSLVDRHNRFDFEFLYFERFERRNRLRAGLTFGGHRCARRNSRYGGERPGGCLVPPWTFRQSHIQHSDRDSRRCDDGNGRLLNCAHDMSNKWQLGLKISFRHHKMF